MTNIAETEIKITRICEADFYYLRPLVEEFISTHPSFSFRENYFSPFCDWLGKALQDENVLPLCAKTNDSHIAGFIVGTIQKNGPLLSPEHLGYVSILVVDKKYRRSGIGESLWKHLCSWFLSKGINYIELYTESGNLLSSSFWSNKGFTTFLEKRKKYINNS